MAALALAGCGTAPTRQAVVMAQPRSELDAAVYGDPAGPPPVAARVTQYVPRTVAAAESTEPYTLDAGDRLRIVVFGQDTLSNTYAVDAAGRIAMPLIGQVNARGLTTAQLSGAIAARLKQSFIRDPSVAVEVETHRPFFILGEVAYPGQYPYVARMTAETAVAIAGGFTPRASKSRVNVTRTVDGRQIRADVPLNQPISPGDSITVGERWF